jgi:thioester reductase-like protein
MVDIWQQLFGIAPIGLADNFFDLGGDSVLIMQLARAIQTTFHLDIPVRLLFTTTTIRELCQTIEKLQANPATTIASEVDFTREILLDSTIQPAVCVPVNTSTLATPQSILLTGVTGFLGAFLLQELWEQADAKTGAKIFALVRAANVQEAEKRLLDILTYCRMFHLISEIGQHIHPLPGDLARPQLGLSPESFQELSHEIDAIYHCGAIVNFAYPYSSLKAANVAGTQEVLRLASLGKQKRVHYISSTAVFSAPDYYNGNVITEETPLAHVARLSTGYAQSKWVAEQLVSQAGERGIPVSIYRIGDIGSDSRTGVWSTKEMLTRIIKACIQLGCAPDTDFQVALLPVDYVSKALVNLSFQKASVGQKFHLVAQQSISWREMLAWLRSCGYPLRILPYQEWYEHLKEQGTPDNALYPLVDALADGLGSTSAETARRFSTRNSDQVLQQSDVPLPAYDEHYFGKMFTFFQQAGFLPEPQRALEYR